MNSFSKFTDIELAQAVELMVSPSDIAIREVAIAIFKTFGYTPNDIAEQLKSGEHFSSGAIFAGLNTSQPKIINTAS